ncbi:MAG: MCE family protein [Nocardioides sp.]
MRRPRIVPLLVLLALVVAGGVVGLNRSGDDGQRQLTVMFPSTISLYEGAQVKVLGVRVGTVESITVEGMAVRVEMTYDPDVDLPADVHALVVPPSIVGDRFIQLAPAYSGDGAVLEDGASLGLDRSGVPLELDDTYRSLDQVATSLGPEGANADGALSRMISAGADNLRGRGQLFNTTIRELAGAIGTLAASSDDIAGTTTNLARFNRELAGKDETIRRLVTNLVLVSTVLNGQRDQLGAAVTTLDRALGKVASFARENRRSLGSALSGLTRVSEVLGGRVNELIEITDLGPVGLTSLGKTYVPGNWDPTNPGASSPDGRTGSQLLHSVALNDFDAQLGYTMTAVCSRLPAEARAQLAAFCGALEEAGGDLGAVLLEITGNTPTNEEGQPR